MGSDKKWKWAMCWAESENESMSLWVNLVMAYGSVRDNAENQEMKNIQ